MNCYWKLLLEKSTDMTSTLKNVKPRSFVVENSVENDIRNLLNKPWTKLRYVLYRLEFTFTVVFLFLSVLLYHSLSLSVNCMFFFCWRVLYLSFIMGWFNWFAFGHQTDGTNVGIPIVTLCTVFFSLLFIYLSNSSRYFLLVIIVESIFRQQFEECCWVLVCLFVQCSCGSFNLRP